MGYREARSPSDRFTPMLTTRAQGRHAKMMARGTGQLVDLIVGKQHATGEVRIARWTGSARLVRAMKMLGVLWGLGVVSVLVPVAHFLLVPAFLLAGPIAAFMRWRQESSILGGQGACPACSADMTLEASADEWPLFRICETCRASVRIEKREVVETLPGPFLA